MPTKLPSRRRWRAPRLSTATRENIAATAAELILALAFVSVTVFVIANIDLIQPSLYQMQTTGVILGP